MATRTSPNFSLPPNRPPVFMTLPSSPGRRPSKPRWSTASTGAARWLRSTDLLPAFGRLESPGFGRGFFVASTAHEDGATWLARPRLSFGHAGPAGIVCDRKLRSPLQAGLRSPSVTCDVNKAPGEGGIAMPRLLLIVGLLA